MFNAKEEIMFNSAIKKDAEKVVLLLLEVKGLIQIIVKFRADKHFVYVSITKHPFEGHKTLITKTIVVI